MVSMLLPVHARSATLILADSRIYIDPSGGFELYLSAAIEKRHLHVTLTNNRATADYAIEGGLRQAAENAVRVVDLRTGDVVFVWSDEGKPASPQQNAEACARKLARNVQLPAKQKSVAKDPVWEF
jgi:hypothetical protein